MIRLTDNHFARLERMNPLRIIPAIGEELEAGAAAIVETAKFNIRDGAISGAGHIPGPVGGFPNADTHVLDESLHVGELIETPGSIRTSAIADAPYALFVERGHINAGPRPFLEPSTEIERPEIVAALGKRFVTEVNT